MNIVELALTAISKKRQHTICALVTGVHTGALPISAIEVDPASAAAQRCRFRHLFVDEFQDVNPLQFRLLEAWRGDRWDVFVVGDSHQSIYGWNGADPALLDELGRRWPALETIRLDRTHRPPPQNPAAAAPVIAAGPPARHPPPTNAQAP